MQGHLSGGWIPEIMMKNHRLRALIRRFHAFRALGPTSFQASGPDWAPSQFGVGAVRNQIRTRVEPCLYLWRPGYVETGRGRIGPTWGSEDVGVQFGNPRDVAV